jgi:hypothetical protein
MALWKPTRGFVRPAAHVEGVLGEPAIYRLTLPVHKAVSPVLALREVAY